MFDADGAFWKFAAWAIGAGLIAASVAGTAVVIGVLLALVFLKTCFNRLV